MSSLVSKLSRVCHPLSASMEVAHLAVSNPRLESLSQPHCQNSSVWLVLLQPSHALPVAALVPTVAVEESSRGFEVFVLPEVDEDPLGVCPLMRLISTVSRSHLCMMTATISHSLSSWIRIVIAICFDQSAENWTFDLLVPV